MNTENEQFLLKIDIENNIFTISIQHVLTNSFCLYYRTIYANTLFFNIHFCRQDEPHLECMSYLFITIHVSDLVFWVFISMLMSIDKTLVRIEFYRICECKSWWCISKRSDLFDYKVKMKPKIETEEGKKKKTKSFSLIIFVYNCTYRTIIYIWLMRKIHFNRWTLKDI